MWCSNCQQDMPGVAHAASGRIVCSRCQQTDAEARSRHHAHAICDDGIALTTSSRTVAVRRCAAISHRRLAARQRVAQHRPRTAPAESRPRSTTSVSIRRSPAIRSAARFVRPNRTRDHATIATSLRHRRRNRRATSRQHGAARWSPGSSSSVGAIALTGGVGLIAWSLSTAQMLYWNLALGLALGGQGTLIFGLCWSFRDFGETAATRPANCKTSTRGSASCNRRPKRSPHMRTGGAPAFYADLVRGASPQVLLANLKGQVDQLATRLGSGLVRDELTPSTRFAISSTTSALFTRHCSSESRSRIVTVCPAASGRRP